MSKECDIVRDLLPLYVDNVVSDTSREIIEEHLSDCDGCKEYLKKLRDEELESHLKEEKKAVIEYGTRQFRKRSKSSSARNPSRASTRMNASPSALRSRAVCSAVRSRICSCST